MASKYDTDDKEIKTPRKGSVNIHTPMSIWICILVLGACANIIYSNGYVALIPPISYALKLFSSFVLALPGIVVLPLIMGGIIGSEVGLRSSNINSGLKSGVLNWIFASVIYIIAIVILFIILTYVAPSAYSPSTTIILEDIFIPLLVFALVIEAFVMLSFYRKTDA